MEKLGSQELRLIGLHDDGDHLVLAGSRGEKYRLVISDELRAAVRRDRPRLEQLKSQSANVLSPREIQARVRSGFTAQEIADSAGITIEQVRRYEGPVLAERQFIAQQAASSRIGRDASSPSLGDLVTDRLAARGVNTEELDWDAARPDGHGWIISVAFKVGGQDRMARWTFDPPARSLHALEDEARWLSETEIVDEPVPQRHLSSVRSSVFDLEADGSIRPVLDAVDLNERPLTAPADELPTPTDRDSTAALLDDLRGRRGVRQQFEPGDNEAFFEGFGPQVRFSTPEIADPRGLEEVPGAHANDTADNPLDTRVYSLPATRTALDEPAPALTVVPTAPPTADATTPASTEDKTRTRPNRRTRSKVPSWDEIVFGGKTEE